MNKKRLIEIFSAGCEVCTDLISQIRAAACASCEIKVLELHNGDIAERGKQLGITSLPAVVMDGKLVSGTDLSTLKAAGLGTPIIQ